MIDVIRAKDFRRIKEAVVDMRPSDGADSLGSHVVLLSGRNGQCKSSVIEAMLWALFGKVRPGTTKDGIVRRSADISDRKGKYGMGVVDMTCDGMRYRIMRWVTARGTTDALAVRIPDGVEDDTDGFSAPSSPSVVVIAHGAKGVTEASCDLLGIGYDGFCASFIARQGELDSLSDMRVEDRRQFILALLGLSGLDAAKKNASQSRRDAEITVKALEGQVGDPEAIKKQIAELEAEKADSAQKIETGRTYVTNQQRKVEEIQAQARLEEELKGKAAEYTNALYAMFSRQAADADELIGIDEAMEQARRASEGYNPEVSAASRQAAAAAAVEDLKRRQSAWRSRRDYEARLASAERGLADASARRDRAKSLVPEHEPDVDKAQEADSAAAGELNAAREAERAASAAFESRRKLVSAVEAGDMAECPVCGTELSGGDGADHLMQGLASLEHDMDSAKARTAAAEQAKRASQAALTLARQEARDYQTRLRDLDKTEAEARRLRESADSIREMIDEAVARCGNGPEPSQGEVYAAQMELERASADLKAEQARRRAHEDLVRLSARREALSSAIAASEPEIDEACELLDGLEAMVAELPGAAGMLPAEQAKLDAYHDRLQQRIRENGSISERLKHAEEQLGEAIRSQRDLKELRRRIEVSSLAHDVIDRLRKTLPERIAPEMSFIASSLLTDATASRYRMLELDKDMSPTVYDDLGPHPMSELSGGEQDVVSLCIRTAISRMVLSSSSASASQLFVLDEIFGALDDDRQELVAGVLKGLANLGLPRILCISHVGAIRELADQIYVMEESEDGSYVTCRKVEAGEQIAEA